jgi:hypothetical protein
MPGVALTLLALLGIGAVFRTGLPAMPDHLSGFRVGAQNDGRGSIRVPASPTPSRSALPTPTPTATHGPVRTSPPSTRRPVTVTPSRPVVRTSEPVRRPVTAKACKAGSAVLAATADAYVDQGSAGKNFGSAQSLVVASRAKGRNQRALLRFALPSIPAGCSLRSATLTVTAKEASRRRLVVARAGRSWNERSVTWANAPAPVGTTAVATVGGSRVSWTVTSLVAAMQSGGNDGFVVRDAAENSKKNVPETTLSSRTAKKGRPTLTIRWA